MKVFILALFFVVVLAAEKKKCRVTSDCGEDECCTFSGLFSKGKCRSLSKENEGCSEDTLDGAYQKRCPCESGLVCMPERTIEHIFFKDVEIRINERCVNENEVTTSDGGEVTIEAE